MPGRPPAEHAQRGQRPPDAARGSALEALAAGCRPTPQQLHVLAATGPAPPDHRPPPQRPWGPSDDLLVRRLSLVRRWSPAAIAVFLNRPEPQVRAALDLWYAALAVRRATAAAKKGNGAPQPVSLRAEDRSGSPRSD